MTTGAAKESALGELHGKVARVMTKALDQIEAKQELFQHVTEQAKGDDNLELLVSALDKDTGVPATLLSVMTKFLADNKITCAAEESGELSELQQRLAANKKKRRVGNVHYLEDNA